MRSTTLITTTLTALAAGPLAGVAAFTVHLCGDSTMACSSGNTQGWGEYLQYSLDRSKAVVANHAIGGRSARSYTREGRFDEVANAVQSGDWVVMEFGHNDGGSLQNDNGRSACFGDGEETCQTVYNGVQETVHTYPWYLKQAATKMLSKGASGVIISEPTPNNVWETGQFSWAPYRFYYYAWLAVSQLGGPAKGVHFVPHGQYSAQAMRNLGADTVNQGYPNDHTHTGPFLADVMAKAFVLGMRCGTSALGQVAINATAELSSSFLGPCVPDFNSTLVELLR